ncbi:MAG: response regulator [Deltaproteobacteria bacterium]|nr:response regulator [Deltaproteobacteria bacterium]
MAKILVIDDDHHILDLLNLILTRSGYDVKTANSGLEGIQLLNGRHCFSLVITDIRMPGADGNQVARSIKTHQKKNDIPVIAISAYPDDAERELFHSILQKPFKIKDLIEMVDSIS